MENNPDRFSVIARSRKQVARPHASRAWCDPPISARRSPSSRHFAPINAQRNAYKPYMYLVQPYKRLIRKINLAVPGWLARVVRINFLRYNSRILEHRRQAPIYCSCVANRWPAEGYLR
ncbi:hypothetical protein EVAR_8874_1 [Eumeta japonica]|uniref:Uncharacterized protein n=1 Tax=Eumeta variegata TaxID=151549 RepID=A0A4C1U0Y5_EUMVA|nr:hypothetical protein EVAR_8874_1 [Eumeta japonica]